MTVVYDAGALIAAERSHRELWAEHRVRLAMGLVPVTTAPVVAQVSRSGRQVQLHRLLRGCEVVPFEAGDAAEIGRLAGRCGIADVVDVHVVATVHRLGFGVVTSDEGDLRPVADHLRPRPPIFPL